MNFFSFGNRRISNNDTDYKSRLERKLYLAKEDPEPIFDLSECNLKSVPSGIYSLCKVFRKEKLYLQVNQLTSLSGGGQLSDLCLLTVLDLHSNHFSTLPEDICYLINLEELNLSSNKLKKLPEGIGSLSKLKSVDVSNNKLMNLPVTLGKLTSLVILNVRDNPNLLLIPPVLSQITTLQELFVDEHLFQDVPSSITKHGTTAILQHVSQKNNTEYFSVRENRTVAEQKNEQQLPSTINYPCRMAEENIRLQESFKLLGRKKEEKLQELLQVEKDLQDQKDKEYKIHENLKKDKNKLLDSLKKQQEQLEEDVTRFHSQKEREREKLLSHLLEVEREAELAIGELLALNCALNQSKQWKEQEIREQQLLNDYKFSSMELRRLEILGAMKSLLAEEYVREEKLLAYEKSKAEAAQNSLLSEVEWGQQISSLLCIRDARQADLISTIEADMDVQKAMVATLLERSDLRTQSLHMQLALVQQQMALLTTVELQQSDMDSQQNLNYLAEKRNILSDLLVDLLKEQEKRQRHLVDELHQLDLDRQVCESNPDFWLQQYQRLLDIRPQQLRLSLDPELVHHFIVHQIAHYLPLLAACDISSLTSSQLSQIGVSNEDDVLAIMHAVNNFLAHKQMQLKPSAPPSEELSDSRNILPESAPPSEELSDSRNVLPECVVCMETQCAVVFIPCGHLCTCLTCATQLIQCPLCRAHVERKIHIIIP